MCCKLRAMSEQIRNSKKADSNRKASVKSGHRERGRKGIE